MAYEGGPMPYGPRKKKPSAIPGGGTGKNSAYMFKQPEGGYRSVKDGGRQPGKQPAPPVETATLKGGLTWGTSLDPHRKEGEPLSAAAQPRSGVNGGWSAHPRFYEQKIAAEQRLGRSLSTEEFERDYFVVPESEVASGTSIFDPVLCELAYRWFCPPSGVVIDPFAGGSVRGIVASKLGRQYLGVDLSARQIAANREQAADICLEPMPVWHEGDAQDIGRILGPAATADFVFSCPPYANLERYSDDPRDLSTLEYPAFIAAYRRVIAGACALLKPNRFACFVVGDVRDDAGLYLCFPWQTIQAFTDAGLRLYNEAVLVTAAGSLPIRAGKQFETSRKMGKTHQNVLIFVKGDPKLATKAIGVVEFGDMALDPAATAAIGGEIV
jgi:hypothetical protein